MGFTRISLRRLRGRGCAGRGARCGPERPGGRARGIRGSRRDMRGPRPARPRCHVFLRASRSLGSGPKSGMARRGTCRCHIPEPGPSVGCGSVKRVLSEKSIHIFPASLPPAAPLPAVCVGLGSAFWVRCPHPAARLHPRPGAGSPCPRPVPLGRPRMAAGTAGPLCRDFECRDAHV